MRTLYALLLCVISSVAYSQGTNDSIHHLLSKSDAVLYGRLKESKPEFSEKTNAIYHLTFENTTGWFCNGKSVPAMPLLEVDLVHPEYKPGEKPFRLTEGEDYVLFVKVKDVAQKQFEFADCWFGIQPSYSALQIELMQLSMENREKQRLHNTTSVGIRQPAVGSPKPSK